MKKYFKRLVSAALCLALTAALIIGVSVPASAAKYDSNTDWIAGKYGIFLHYLLERQGGGSSLEGWNSAVSSFDVDRFAKDINSVGASWVTITLTQSSGYFPIPMPEMENLTGVKCGTERDLVTDLINACEPYGIKVMLYWNPGLPQNNLAMARALGAAFRQNQGDMSIGQGASGDWVLNYTAAKNVCSVLSALSERYGEKVHGWWFDGCYDNVGFNERLAELYGEAARAGNPKTLVAFNDGIRFADCRYESENYACGETCHPYFLEETSFMNYKADSRWTENGYQAHRLTFLGENWGLGGTIYDTAELAKHSYDAFLKNGAALSFDVAISADGKIADEHLAQLKAVYDYVKSQPAPVIEPAPKNTETKADTSSSATSGNTSEEVVKKVQVVSKNQPLYIALGAECAVIIGVAVFWIIRKKRVK